MRNVSLRAALAAAVLLSAAHADAVVLLDGKLNVSGYAYWAYGRTDGNRFQLGNQDGYYDNAALALAVRVQPLDNLSAAIQFTQDEDPTQNGMDYAFFEWKVSDSVRLRFGMPKVPLGLSWDVNDLGTVRPFLRLPNSIYGNTNFGGYSYLGVGLAGTKELPRGFELGYDVFVGGLSQFVISPNDALNVQAEIDTAGSGNGVDVDYPGTWVEVQDVVGGRLTLVTPIQGLSARASYFWGRTPDPYYDFELRPTWMASGSLEYAGEVLLVRAEYAHLWEQGFGASNAGYVEAGVRLGEHWQAVAKVEATKLDWSSSVVPDESLLRHTEGAVGVNYWFTRDFVLKASFHTVKGNRFTLPAWADNVFHPYTNELMVGSQFSF
jgi:hypothetical protein